MRGVFPHNNCPISLLGSNIKKSPQPYHKIKCLIYQLVFSLTSDFAISPCLLFVLSFVRVPIPKQSFLIDLSQPHLFNVFIFNFLVIGGRKK